MRLDTTTRGIIIAVLIAISSWALKQSGGSLGVALLIGALVQVAVLIARRFVPPDAMPQTVYIIEMIADGVTVLLCALGVFGAVSRFPAEV
jgi:hypothetical protein